MPALNKIERRKAFLNFLIFFAVTVTIIIAAVFFSIEVPFNDNKQLRDQLAEMQDQRDVMQSFQTEIFETSSLVKTYDSRDLRQAPVNAQIDASVYKLNNLIRSVPDSQSIRYLNAMVDNLNALRDKKREFNEVQSSGLDAAKLKQENLDLKIQLNQKEQTIAQLLQQRAQPQ